MIINGGGAFHQTKGQALKSAGHEILELKREAKEGVAFIERLKWQNAQLRVAIMALGEHFNLSAPAMKIIVDAYIAKEEIRLKKDGEDAKAKYMEALKDGKAPPITMIDGTEKPE